MTIRQPWSVSPFLLAFVTLCLLRRRSRVGCRHGRREDAPLNATTLAGLKWRGLGPALMSGRIADIAVADRPGHLVCGRGQRRGVEDRQQRHHLAAHLRERGQLLGGVRDHRSRMIRRPSGSAAARTSAAGTWVTATACIAAATGDRPGRTWGFEESEHIGRIVVHPQDPNTVYVAAQGPLWSEGGERGVYMTHRRRRDLGAGAGRRASTPGPTRWSWTPRTRPCCTPRLHQRFRDVAALMDGGPESGIHKSTDGGRTWRAVEDRPARGRTWARSAWRFRPSNPSVMYAAIELGERKGGFWRSANGGESWEKRSDKVARRDRSPLLHRDLRQPARLRPGVLHGRRDGRDPRRRHRPSPRWAKRTNTWTTTRWSSARPTPTTCWPVVTAASTRAGTWARTGSSSSNLPVTQFYKVAVDYDEPFYHIIGGTQDNNTQYGPVRTDNLHGLRNADWRVTLFGDGHQPAIDPTNPDIIYSSLQQCRFYRVDRPTGEVLSHQAAPGRG